MVSDLGTFQRTKKLFRKEIFRDLLYIIAISQIFIVSQRASIGVIFDRYGYFEEMAGITQICQTVLEIIGSFVFFIYLRNKDFQYQLFTISAVLAFSFISLNFVFLGNTFLVLFGFLALGFFFGVNQPLGYELITKYINNENLGFINSVVLTVTSLGNILSILISDFIFFIFSNKRDANFIVEVYLTALLILIYLKSLKII